MFRAYAPTKAFFDKTWQLPDIEKIAAKVDPKAGSADVKSAAQSMISDTLPVTVGNFARRI